MTVYEPVFTDDLLGDQYIDQSQVVAERPPRQPTLWSSLLWAGSVFLLLLILLLLWNSFQRHLVRRQKVYDQQFKDLMDNQHSIFKNQQKQALQLQQQQQPQVGGGEGGGGGCENGGCGEGRRESNDQQRHPQLMPATPENQIQCPSLIGAKYQPFIQASSAAKPIHM